jgi:hypothetical protein
MAARLPSNWPSGRDAASYDSQATTKAAVVLAMMLFGPERTRAFTGTSWIYRWNHWNKLSLPHVRKFTPPQEILLLMSIVNAIILKKFRVPIVNKLGFKAKRHRRLSTDSP